MDERLTVVDLFCGGGGFSEGFRQAGFEITHAVDWSNGAISTYNLNVPPRQDTEVLQRSLLKDIDKENLPSSVPEDITPLGIDELPENPTVVIGSPPCTEFSWSKNGGGGNKRKGKSTVSRFFELVSEMDPEYWVMENVPNSESHVKEAFRNVDALSISGDIDDYIHILDCSEYGTPQRRERLFFGNIPISNDASPDPLTLGEVVNEYQNIRAKDNDEIVTDPLYPSLTIPKSEITDCFYQPYLTKREKEDIRRRKVDHSIYGRMAFPEESDRSARTVMASDRTLARETLVVRDADSIPKTGRWEWSPFRKLTIREIATLQGFPITYQFTGKSVRKKWRRVGDAVPPTVGYHIANSILSKENIGSDQDSPVLEQHINEPDTNLNGSGTRSRRQIRITRPFRHHVPWDNKRNFRVDLATSKENLPEHPLSNSVEEDVQHPVRYYVILNRGYAKKHEEQPVSMWEVQTILSQLIDEKQHLEQDIRRFLAKINNQLAGIVPDATTLQATRSFRKDWANEAWDDLREFEILSQISSPNSKDEKGVVEDAFPIEEFKNVSIEVDDLFDGCNLPIRVLMKLVAVSYVAHKLNNCGQWIKRNPERVYLPKEIDRSEIQMRENPECKSIAPLDKCIEARFRRYSNQSNYNHLFKPENYAQGSSEMINMD